MLLALSLCSFQIFSPILQQLKNIVKELSALKQQLLLGNYAKLGERNPKLPKKIQDTLIEQSFAAEDMQKIINKIIANLEICIVFYQKNQSIFSLIKFRTFLMSLVLLSIRIYFKFKFPNLQNSSFHFLDSCLLVLACFLCFIVPLVLLKMSCKHWFYFKCFSQQAYLWLKLQGENHNKIKTTMHSEIYELYESMLFSQSQFIESKDKIIQNWLQEKNNLSSSEQEKFFEILCVFEFFFLFTLSTLYLTIPVYGIYFALL